MKQYVKFHQSITLIIIGLAILSSSYSVLPQRVAYINIDVLIERYYEMDLNTIEFQHQKEHWQSMMNTFEMEIADLINQYEKEQNASNEYTLKELEHGIHKKQEEYIDYQATINLKRQKRSKEIRQKVLCQIDDLMKEYSRKYGYDINFITDERVASLDITQIILNHLNKNYNEEAKPIF